MNTIKKTITSIAASVALLGFAGISQATPKLQIDIDGATYDATETEQSIVTGDTVFDLYAIGTPQGSFTADTLIGTVYYLSIAIIPQIGPDPVDIGSFVVNGTTYDINDMVYGTPPLDDYTDSPEAGLAPHSVYDTFYMQLVVDFVVGATVGTYNVQDDPGSITSHMGGTGSYYDMFQFDISGLNAGINLHFDLYDVVVANGPKGALGDMDDGIFAPFSHDARTNCCTRVPEPSTVGLFGLGLLGVALIRRRRQLDA